MKDKRTEGEIEYDAHHYALKKCIQIVKESLRGCQILDEDPQAMIRRLRTNVLKNLEEYKKKTTA